MLNTFLVSGFFSVIWSGIFLLGSQFLDKYILHFYATAISSLITSVGNFITQYNLFSKGTLETHHILKYTVVAIIEMFVISFIASRIINDKKYTNNIIKRSNKKIRDFFDDYFNTLARILAGIICFFIVSFPLRKYWIFKK